MPPAASESAEHAAQLARAASRAREAHQRGLRAGSAWRPAVAARYMRSGLRALGCTEGLPAADLPAEHRALAARLLMSLAHYEAEQGRTDYGLKLLGYAGPLAAAADRGVLMSQQGLLLMRLCRDTEAIALFSEALPLLADYPDLSYLARTLLNRGFSYLNIHDVRRARADAASCEQVSKASNLDLMAVKAAQNLAYCDLLEGDLPGALRLLAAAADGYRRTAPSALPVLGPDKARVLLAAGLAREAAQELEAAIIAFRRQRLDQDHAEAQLARAEAALAAGEPADAVRWATAAARHFRRRGNDTRACLAELIRLRARATVSARPSGIAAEAQAIAGRLRGCGLRNDADTAELIAARALVAAGRPGAARQRIALVRRSGPVSLDVSMLRKLARAEIAGAQGRSGTALTELRAGLAILHAYRGRLGSLDLQTSTAALGADLAAAGLRLAMDSGSARLVFAWLERSRAQAFQLRPVKPPADPQTADLLAELRQVCKLLRDTELNGHRDPAVAARRSELQRLLRERSWQMAGPRARDAQSNFAERLEELSAALHQDNQIMISLLARDSRMYAVIFKNSALRLTGLGDLRMAREAATRLRADLNTLAGRRLAARLALVVSESVRYQTGVLDAELITPLRQMIGDDSIVLAPMGAFTSLPWGLLPSLRGRPVSVCPSAASWLAAWHRAYTTPPATAGTVLVAGPYLAHAAAEVMEIAKIHPGCRTLLPGTATVSSTLSELDGAQLAHLAAHGHHDQENVLFSRLELADGPLMAYDVQGLAVAPSQVVLSACDVGQTEVRKGEEILGFTAALLYTGTTTVISSATRVADNTAIHTMNAYHRALHAGARPAEALALAAAAQPHSPFVCFGAG